MAKQRGGARTFWVTLVVVVLIAAIILGVLGGLGYFKKKGGAAAGGGSGAPSIPASGSFQPSGSGSIHFPGGLKPQQCNSLIVEAGINATKRGETLTGNMIFNWDTPCGELPTHPSDLWGEVAIDYDNGVFTIPIKFTSLVKQNQINWSTNFVSATPVRTDIPAGFYNGTMNVIVSNNELNPLISKTSVYLS